MPRWHYALLVSASLASAAISGTALASLGPQSLSRSFGAVVASQYGAVAPHGAAFVSQAASVPEPGSIALISAGLTLLLATTRRFMG